MNRFFSKLNLQDIKINPEGNRFPPDADETEEHIEEQQVETVEVTPVAEADVVVVEEETPAPSWQEPVEDTPSVAIVPPATENGHHDTIVRPVEAVAPSNGHVAVEEATTVEYIADGAVIAVDGEVLKVSARSRPSAVAGAIAGVVRESGHAEVQAIGAGATNQAVKAVAIARDYLRETGIDAICVPAFIDVTIDNEDRTAIRLVVEPR